MTVSRTEVAIVGAGPYGLAMAAHLGERGIAFRIFGSPMKFWRQMPATLNLKSFAFATSIPVPQLHFTFPEYCRTHGLPDVEPCSMVSFADYGLWVQRTLVPQLESLDVTGLRAKSGGFLLTLANAATLEARRVVIAIGLTGFEAMPPALASVTPAFASHTSEHTDFSRFKGQSVAVIGAGASAVEAAVLLREAGARPLLLVRGAEVVFHTKMDPKRSLAERLRNPNSVLGPGRKSWALEHFPTAVHYLPEARRVRFTRGYLGPAGPWWLWDRFKGNVPVALRSRLIEAEASSGKVRLRLSEAGEERVREFDYVLAGTGFEVDVERIPFLDTGLCARIRRVERSPALSRHFESSVPGLYFIGTAAAFSFGPLFRFVAGSAFAVPVVAKHIARAV
jgi:cation diffusion facilitator CzcD-associated flavoprotein CzcO